MSDALTSTPHAAILRRILGLGKYSRVAPSQQSDALVGHPPGEASPPPSAPPAAADIGLTSIPLLYTYAAVVSWGLWGFLTKFASSDLSAGGLKVWVFFGQVLATAVVLAVIRFRVKWHRVGTTCALACGFLGAMGDLALYAAFRNGGPGSLLVALTALAPVITVVLVIIFLGERLGWREVWSVVIAIVAGVLLST